MRHSDRLDAQLSARLGAGPGTLRAIPPRSEDTLAQLVAADALTHWRYATPRAGYVDVLEARMLAHAAMVATRTARQMAANAPDQRAIARNESASLAEAGAAPWQRGDARRASVPQGRGTARGVRRLGPFGSLAAAALLLFTLGAGVVIAAANAGPGSPLYGLHRFEQDVRVSMANTPSERVRLRLAYARADLAAIEKALGQHAAGSRYTDALEAFHSDLQAIQTDLPALASSASADQQQLVAQVAALEAQGRSELLQALPSLQWSAQLKTTSALGILGVVVPSVSKATITRTLGPGGERDTRILVVGSNFQQGAAVVINGDAAGFVVSQTSTQLVVQLDPGYPVTRAKTIGVSNPDGTAADTTDIVSNLDAGNGKGPAGGDSATPGPAATATNGNGNSGGRPGGGAHGTPTPSH